MKRHLRGRRRHTNTHVTLIKPQTKPPTKPQALTLTKEADPDAKRQIAITYNQLAIELYAARDLQQASHTPPHTPPRMHVSSSIELYAARDLQQARISEKSVYMHPPLLRKFCL